MEDGYSALLIPRSTSPILPPSPPPSAAPPPLPRSAAVPDSAARGLDCSTQLLLFFSDVPRALALISVLLALIVIVFIVLLAEAVHAHSQCEAAPAVSSSLPPSPPASFACGVDGVDLTPLSYADLQYSAPYWLYSLRPCSSVQSPPHCVEAFSSSQLCQTQGQETYNLNSYSASTGSWYRESAGAVVYRGTGGESCSEWGDRSVLIRYDCDRNAAAAFISSVDELRTCSYTVTVHTTLTC